MIIFSTLSSDAERICQEDPDKLGYVVGEELDTVCSEDTAYEYFCDIADRLIGVPITAVARFDAGEADSASLFRTRVRAIYRASVWGQFSLLCSGISTPSELESCCDILSEAFCELESEGREFNGFIEKGVCIDFPMTLYNMPKRLKFDFICIDFEGLCKACAGGKSRECEKRELAAQIMRICSERELREVSLRAATRSEADDASKLLTTLNIQKIYLGKA
jgi:hypothetical protein